MCLCNIVTLSGMEVGGPQMATLCITYSRLLSCSRLNHPAFVSYPFLYLMHIVLFTQGSKAWRFWVWSSYLTLHLADKLHQNFRWVHLAVLTVRTGRSVVHPLSRGSVLSETHIYKIIHFLRLLPYLKQTRFYEIN